MNLRHPLVLLVIVGMTLSCSVPFAAAPPAVATTLPATLTPAAAPTDTVTPAPTATPTTAPTATSSAPRVTPSKDPVNCRFGPATGYESQGSGLAVAASVPILGRTADSAWWQIQDPSAPNLKCWVSAGVTIASGDLSGVLVVPSPAAFVTDVKVSVTPKEISFPGCMGPLPLSALAGTIHVNGPVSVEWHFETQQGGVQPSHTINFTKFGSQDVSGSVGPSAVEGSYWVRLVISSPNNMLDEDTYSIDC